jgi:acyl-CoA hydrolase
VDRKVAQMIVEEIPDGACLQLGIGGMPNAVGMLIGESDLKDLGVHTEMYVDAFVDLTAQGKINGSRKNIDRFRQVFAFATGTQKLYDFIHDNPSIQSCPVDYINDVSRVAMIDNFVSINNAVEIDLFGQISSESSGTKQISGTGGQLDFVMGAYLSKGGKSFICLSSTYGKTGNVGSRIVPTLTSGSIVTASRTCAQWVVTEFGKVNLKGKSTWQRAEALISIAHPDFRDDLVREAEKMNIWRNSNRL